MVGTAALRCPQISIDLGRQLASGTRVERHSRTPQRGVPTIVDQIRPAESTCVDTRAYSVTTVGFNASAAGAERGEQKNAAEAE